MKETKENNMAWWDHEELKSLESRSERYVLVFPEDYTAEYVRQTALKVLQHPKHFSNLQERAKQMLNYGLSSTEKPKFKVKYVSRRSE